MTILFSQKAVNLLSLTVGTVKTSAGNKAVTMVGARLPKKRLKKTFTAQINANKLTLAPLLFAAQTKQAGQSPPRFISGIWV